MNQLLGRTGIRGNIRRVYLAVEPLDVITPRRRAVKDPGILHPLAATLGTREGLVDNPLNRRGCICNTLWTSEWLKLPQPMRHLRCLLLFTSLSPRPASSRFGVPASVSASDSCQRAKFPRSKLVNVPIRSQWARPNPRLPAVTGTSLSSCKAK